MNYKFLTYTNSKKIGGFSIYLGVMLFINLYFFLRGRRNSRRSTDFTPETPEFEAQTTH
ncbi:hypothetical protein [Subsaximicrobium wynnwilliamsii]|uniref:hypothetical protein n=1 Tax=Subsaximicrobium wynnwilliamsii TaxID=291179 RepID=UPI00167C3622|nr:hypothetical protein [Subsaximicrobium wynnwilliamsii]